MIDKVSVGFSTHWSNLICSSCGRSIFDVECEHVPEERRINSLTKEKAKKIEQLEKLKLE